MSELFKQMQAEIARTPQQTGVCATCGEFIRSTPCLHADGSIHWSSSGWEHVLTERAGCVGEQFLFRFAKPVGGGTGQETP